MISAQYISALVLILTAILPKLGVQIGSADLTTWIQAIITVVGGAYIMYKRYQVGDINLAGVKQG